MSPLLEIDGLTKRFGGFLALNRLSLYVNPGERFGLIGPNGSGKTTLINCVSGSLPADGGRIVFDGRDITGLAAHRRTRLGLVRSFQIPKPFSSMTVLENLDIPLEYAAHERSDAADADAMEILRAIGLESKAHLRPAGLTQIEMRKLELARAMAARPKLLISDEAMAGLSHAEVDDILAILFGLNARGITIIMIEHIMRAVMRFSERIVVLDAGERVALTRKATEEMVSLGIALVPEGRRLFPRLSVEENLLLGAYRRSARADIAANLAFAYDAFPVLRSRKSQLAGSMSGGEQQMLAVARALMSSPRILLVDEPSVGLAPILVSRVIAKIKELKEQYHLTVLMAEQNFNQATKIADRGYIIVHGKIEFEGRNTRELRENELVKKYYLGV